MPQGKVEAVCVLALVDVRLLIVGIIELGRTAAEARTSINAIIDALEGVCITASS